MRIDGRYALSRISQYAATPCLGAYNALIHLLDYYQSTPTLCLRQSLHERGEWTFYSDSDLAGNPEAACKRRSQLGYVALNNGPGRIPDSNCLVEPRQRPQTWAQSH